MSVKVCIVEGAVEQEPASVQPARQRSESMPAAPCSSSASTPEHPSPAPGSAGARLVFQGIVRAVEDGRRIVALHYEAYRPMADRELERLAQSTSERFGLHFVEVHHSVGRVPVGACSFRLVLESAHRREALEAMRHFIDELKRDVPIWKQPVWSDAGTGTHAGDPVTRRDRSA